MLQTFCHPPVQEASEPQRLPYGWSFTGWLCSVPGCPHRCDGLWSCRRVGLRGWGRCSGRRCWGRTASCPEALASVLTCCWPSVPASVAQGHCWPRAAGSGGGRWPSAQAASGTQGGPALGLATAAPWALPTPSGRGPRPSCWPGAPRASLGELGGPGYRWMWMCLCVSCPRHSV